MRGHSAIRQSEALSTQTLFRISYERRKATNLVQDPKENLIRYIDFIFQRYQKEYGKYSRVHENLWQWITLTIMILGFVPALVLGIQGVYKSGGPGYELLKAIPPLVASLLAAVLSSFKVYEKFRLRERGRLYFTDLVTEAKIRFAQCKREEDYSQLHDYLRRRVTGEQYRQMISYFGLHDEKLDHSDSQETQ